MPELPESAKHGQYFGRPDLEHQSTQGVVVTILDDGIQYNHPDLAQNYDPLASKDINDGDDDPMPQVGPG